MKYKFIVLLISVVAFSFAQSAQACDLCSVYSVNRTKGFAGKGFQIGLAEQFTHFGTLKQDSQTVANTENQYLDSSITQLFVSYNFMERLGAQLNLPVIVRHFSRPDGMGGTDSGTVSGVGDVTLSTKFHAYETRGEKFSFNVSFMGGLKLPTGSTSRMNEELNEMDMEDEDAGTPSGIHGHELSLGSGSVDGVIGGDVFASWRRFFVTADIQYAIRTRGAIDYRFANDLHWSFAPGGYLLLNHHSSFALQGKISGAYKSLDDLNGASALDTGVTEVFLGPEMTYTFKDHLNASVGADLPIVINNTAFQAVPDYRLRGSVAWRF